MEAAFQFALAKFLAEESSFGEALAAYERSLELDGTDPYSRLELARFHVYLAQGARNRAEAARQLDAAAEAVAVAVALAPENPEVLRTYGRVHLQLADMRPDSMAKARRAFETLREKDEADLQNLTSLGQIYLWERRYEQAAEVLAEASALRPRHRMLMTMLMEAQLYSGQLEAAEGTLEGLLGIQPDSVENRVRLADLKSKRGDHRGALALLRAAPSDVADSPSLRQQLARELHLIGESGEALQVLDGLLDEDAKNTNLKRLRVAALSAATRDEEALAELRSVPPADAEETYRDALLASRLLERLGRSDEAEQSLRKLLQGQASGEDGAAAELKAEQQQELVTLLAGVLERRGERAKARSLLVESAADYEGRQKAVLLRLAARIEERTGRTDQALALLDQAMEASAEDDRPALQMHRLMVLAEAEQWPRLFAQTEPLVASEDDALALGARLLRAEALAHQEQVDEALQLVTAGDAEGGEQSPRLRAQRLQIMLEHGREQEALDELAASTKEADADQLIFASQVLQQSEYYAESVPYLRRLLELRPESAAGQFLLGAGLERSGQRELAAEAFQQLLERRPDHAGALNYLGYMWAEHGENLEEALALIRRAVALDQDNGAYLDSLGWALYQLGRFEEARPLLEWASRLVPYDATVLEHLGDVYRALGRSSDAADLYRRALVQAEEDEERLALERKLDEVSERGR